MQNFVFEAPKLQFEFHQVCGKPLYVGIAEKKEDRSRRLTQRFIQGGNQAQANQQQMQFGMNGMNMQQGPMYFNNGSNQGMRPGTRSDKFERKIHEKRKNLVF